MDPLRGRDKPGDADIDTHRRPVAGSGSAGTSSYEDQHPATTLAGDLDVLTRPTTSYAADRDLADALQVDAVCLRRQRVPSLSLATRHCQTDPCP